MSLLLPLVTVFCFLIDQSSSQYALKDHYSGNNFFDGWYFYTGNDPTNGYVNYVAQSTAQNNGYISTSSSSVYMGCDHTNVASGRGRDSVRISSKNTYNSGLFLLQFEHMPYGCGTWPAWWTVGPNWPNGGEIDIIEGVNLQNHNDMTLHTSDGCDFSSAPKNYSGNTNSENCYAYANGNQGCGIENPDSKSYGSGFNNDGGGLIATEWDDIGIRIWFWTMGNIPSNVNSSDPIPDNWGVPVAAWKFGSWCPSSKFSNMEMIFDLTFCGDWAGNVWSSGGCASSTGNGNCNNYVQYNPSAFKDAYWIIDYVSVYQQT